MTLRNRRESPPTTQKSRLERKSARQNEKEKSKYRSSLKKGGSAKELKWEPEGREDAPEASGAESLFSKIVFERKDVRERDRPNGVEERIALPPEERRGKWGASRIFR